MVGEDGPELMFFNGGEKVLNAAQTSALQTKAVPAASAIPAVTGSIGAATNMEMHFHIESGAQPETVDAWQNYANSGALKATILEVLEDAEADARRRGMT